MYSYSVIPDNCHNFFEFINELPLADIYKTTLQNSLVLEVNINPGKSVWEVVIRVKDLLPSDICRVIEQELVQKCNLQKVKISQTVAELNTYLKNSQTSFLKEITKDNPGIRTVLADAKWEISKNTLVFELNGSLAVQMLNERKLGQLISAHILAKLGLEYFTPDYLAALDNCSSAATEK